MAFRPLGDPPPQPHVVCANGYWTHPDRPWGCVVGQTALLVEEVYQCFRGGALERADRIAELTAADLQVLFPVKCGCGANHRKLALSLIRAHKLIRPGARKAAERLGVRDLIAVAAERGNTDEETERAQIVRAASISLQAKPNAGEQRAEPTAVPNPTTEDLVAQLRRMAALHGAASGLPCGSGQLEDLALSEQFGERSPRAKMEGSDAGDGLAAGEERGGSSEPMRASTERDEAPRAGGAAKRSRRRRGTRRGGDRGAQLAAGEGAWASRPRRSA